MKLNIYFCLSCVLISSATAEIKFGDNSALGVGLQSGARQTSNALLDSSEQEDFILSMLPTINYRRAAGAMSFDAFVGLEFVRYAQLSDNDSENLKSGFTVTLPEEAHGENYTLVLSGGFNEYTAASSALLAVTETQELSLSAMGTYYVSEYTSLRSGVEYVDKVVSTAGFVDVQTLSIPVALYYDYDEALSFGLGYRFGRSDVGGGSAQADSNDHTVFLGMEDLISPLVQYALKVGYQYRDFSDDTNFEDGGGVFAQARLTWFLSEMTELVGVVRNEFDTSAANQSSETFTTGLTLKHRINERTQLGLGVNYEDVNFDQVAASRSDEQWTYSLKANYNIPGSNFVVNGGLSYADHGSDLAIADYELIDATLGCSLLF